MNRKKLVASLSCQGYAVADILGSSMLDVISIPSVVVSGKPDEEGRKFPTEADKSGTTMGIFSVSLNERVEGL
jgi:hypothetical protein